ncbi:SDR family NAD(P)-dependent oxidoreductase [Microlunatus soli]|uniref:NAD(P)-dependent dehydrogenase, short-chain alcohol dehydrogenase family n=1 Tax=Microlunatus soli TaxID=630515 RepID=A0A1H1PQT2_9ACTN|nr:SDR family oxidoreductase [Microlunatus soli]SDS13632.1 NAD(P)-dependent dehydrogenase, short-chain alcohol dehydrogenase family [Microlunatus soli]
MPESTPQYASYPSLSGKHAFISGGASGIGEADVRHLAGQGATVSFVDLDTDRGEKLAQELTDGGATAFFQRADVTDVEDYLAKINTAAEQHGPITVLVNNAANDKRTPFADVTVDQWDSEIAVNIRHHFFAAQAVAPMMREAGGGSIINMGSITAHLDFPNLTGYIASKAGIEGLTRTQGREYGKWNIRVNCIIPGWILTEKQLEVVAKPGDIERLTEQSQKIPNKLYGEDIARMVLWLAADDSRNCTGQKWVVDGGWM